MFPGDSLFCLRRPWNHNYNYSAPCLETLKRKKHFTNNHPLSAKTVDWWLFCRHRTWALSSQWVDNESFGWNCISKNMIFSTPTSDWQKQDSRFWTGLVKVQTSLQLKRCGRTLMSKKKNWRIVVQNGQKILHKCQTMIKLYRKWPFQINAVKRRSTSYSITEVLGISNIPSCAFYFTSFLFNEGKPVKKLCLKSSLTKIRYFHSFYTHTFVF